MQQKEAFDTMIHEKYHILSREATLINRKIDSLALRQLHKGGNAVITDNVLLERIVKHHEERDRWSKLREKHVFNSRYVNKLHLYY